MPTEWKPETNYRSNERVKFNDQGKVLALLCMQPGRSGNSMPRVPRTGGVIIRDGSCKWKIGK